jgi:two-component system phosphate regulon sensor histidine kinase PhoR
VVSIGMTLTIGYIVYAFVSRPLRRMAEASQELAVGNLDHRIPVVGDGDLARVGSSLNAMARSLRLKMGELVDGKKQIEATVESMSPGVVVFDRDARVVLANKAIRQLLEIPRDPAGRTPMELVRHSVIEHAVRDALESKDVPAFHLETPAGRPLLVKATPVGQLSGQAERAVVVFHDLTELRRTEKFSDFKPRRVRNKKLSIFNVQLSSADAPSARPFQEEMREAPPQMTNDN